MWEICPFKAYNICYIFCYFLNSQDLHLQIAFMNLNKIQIGKFCMTFLPSIMQVKSIHWMVYLDLINMNHELDQMAQVIPLQWVKEIYAIKVLCDKFLLSRISFLN